MDSRYVHVYKNDEKVFSSTRKALEQTLKRTASPGAEGGISERNTDDRTRTCGGFHTGPLIRYDPMTTNGSNSAFQMGNPGKRN